MHLILQKISNKHLKWRLSMGYADITKLIDKIEHTRLNEIEYKKKLCYQLIENSIQKHNKNGIACAMYILARINYQQGKFKQSLEFLLRGEAYVKRGEKYTLKIDYNTLFGILYSRLGNEQQSFSYFLKGIKLAKLKREGKRLRILYRSIAHAYQIFGDYEDALEYYKKEKLSYRLRSVKEEKQVLSYDLFLLECHLGTCYLSLDELKKAEDILENIKNYLSMYTNEQRLPYYYFYCRLLFAKGFYEDAKETLDLFINTVQEMEFYVDYFDACIEMVQVLMDTNLKEEAYQYVVAIGKMSTKAMSEEYRLKYFDAKIRFGLIFHPSENMEEDFEEFLKLSERMEEVFRQAKHANLKNRKRFDDTVYYNTSMMSNLHYLKERSEHDALTKLANRYCLNEYLEKNFKKAREKGYTIGIDVLDVDYFKQYNDTFGHLFGDQCLVEIADTMREVAPDYFLARFGGDEFFIVFLNADTARVLEIANRLKEVLISKAISQAQEIPYQCLTISQGLVNAVPKMGQTVSDFIHCADMALYKGKKLTKNSIFLGEIT